MPSATLHRTDRATTSRTLEQRQNDRRARDALHRRLDQLDHDAITLTLAIHCAERAVVWLAPRDRPLARRRLRKLGHDEQLDALGNLRDTLDDVAA